MDFSTMMNLEAHGPDAPGACGLQSTWVYTPVLATGRTRADLDDDPVYGERASDSRIVPPECTTSSSPVALAASEWGVSRYRLRSTPP